MNKSLVKILAFILYFYSPEKRKAFRTKHNPVSANCAKLRAKGIIGENTYLAAGCSVVDRRSRIGKFCSIAKNVSIGTTAHPTNFLTTSPIPYMDISNITGGLSIPKDRRISFQHKKPVMIGNDVWIGLNAVIMDGVTIGDGAIIGAGAIVTKDISPYAIALGVPAKVIKYRFPEETIQRLLKTRWWDQPDSVIRDLPFQDVEACLTILEEMNSANR